MFRLVEELEEFTHQELETWYRRGGRYRTFRRGSRVYGFISFNPYLRVLCYVTPRRPEHFLIKHQSFGVSEWVLRELEHCLVEYVFIRYVNGRDEVLWHLAPLSRFVDGIFWVDPQTGDPQWHCTRSLYEIIGE